MRMLATLVDEMRADLRRPHAFAHERVGFLCCRQSRVPSGHLLLGYRFVVLDDDRYVPDEGVGARFDAAAIRSGMQMALTENASVFHVHLHDHVGPPRMSLVDTEEMQELMPCFVNVCPNRMHGALVLSANRAYARIWGTAFGPEGIEVARITSVGNTIKVLS
jgi:hypothetical protein